MLNIDVQENQGVMTISLNGEVDIYTVDLLKEKLEVVKDVEGTEIVFDLKKLDYIDSTGLGAIIGVKGKNPQASIKVINMKSNVARLFEITGLNKIFVTE